MPNLFCFVLLLLFSGCFMRRLKYPGYNRFQFICLAQFCLNIVNLLLMVLLIVITDFRTTKTFLKINRKNNRNSFPSQTFSSWISNSLDILCGRCTLGHLLP